MRWIHCALLAVIAGCSSDEITQPKENVQPPQYFGAVAGFVLSANDDCIIGAKVVVVDGVRAGASFTQTVCGIWDYGSDLGYSFVNLPIGTPVTLRATADGFTAKEITALPRNPYQYTTYIRLTKN